MFGFISVFPYFSPGRVVFAIELYLQTERVLIVGAETQETQHDWFQALTKVIRFACNTHTQTKVCYFSLAVAVHANTSVHHFHLPLEPPRRLSRRCERPRSPVSCFIS